MSYEKYRSGSQCVRLFFIEIEAKLVARKPKLPLCDDWGSNKWELIIQRPFGNRRLFLTNVRREFTILGRAQNVWPDTRFSRKETHLVMIIRKLRLPFCFLSSLEWRVRCSKSYYIAPCFDSPFSVLPSTIASDSPFLGIFAACNG